MTKRWYVTGWEGLQQTILNTLECHFGHYTVQRVPGNIMNAENAVD